MKRDIETLIHLARRVETINMLGVIRVEGMDGDVGVDTAEVEVDVEDSVDSSNHRDRAMVPKVSGRAVPARARDRMGLADEDEGGDTIGVDINNDKKHHTKRSTRVC